jgi:thiamine-phosphate pyrophosphorylase
MITPDDARLRLIVVTDDLRDGVEGLAARACAAERGGATLVLLRLKHADAAVQVEAGRALVPALRIPVLVSDRFDVALACGAAGVHLTSSSMPAIAVRQGVPEAFLVGASVSSASDLEMAMHADFVTFGPIAGTDGTGMGIEGFRRLARACGRPAVAIGGVDATMIPLLRDAGAVGVAVIRAVFGAPDVEAAARGLADAWT